MSKKAKALLKQAVALYLKEDGATDMGAHRDAITDILHLAFENEKTRPRKVLDPFQGFIHQAAWEAFTEELEQKEHDEINRLHQQKKLPLHIHRKWFFPTSGLYFDQLLKGK
jgi:hypothetical protein